MPYSTKADVLAAYPDYATEVLDSDGDGSLDSAEDTALDKAIAWADAKIDAYIGVKFDLPLPETPATIKDLSIDLAMYRRAATADRMTEIIEKRKDDAIDDLIRLSKGQMSLGLSSPPASLDGGVQLLGNTREFTKAKWDDV